MKEVEIQEKFPVSDVKTLLGWAVRDSTESDALFFFLMLFVQLCHSHLFAEAGSSDASTGHYSVAV